MLQHTSNPNVEPTLTAGWHWVDTNWLFYWVVTLAPINNRCAMLTNNIDPQLLDTENIKKYCLHCPAAYKKRGDLICWYVNEFKKLLLGEISHFWAEQYLLRLKQQSGFDRLLSAANLETAPVDWCLTDVSHLQPFDSLIGDPIVVFVEDGKAVFIRGRHRVCAARKFEVKALPIFAQES